MWGIMPKNEVPPIALIIAGGRGERLRPLTDNLPKPLLVVAGKPVLEYSIEELKRNGIKDILIFVSYKAGKITSYFKDGSKWGVRIKYIKGVQTPGNGGNLKIMLKSIKGRGYSDILAMNSDDIFKLNIPEMFALHKKEKALITISLVRLKDATGKGVVKLKGKRIVEF